MIESVHLTVSLDYGRVCRTTAGEHPSMVLLTEGPRDVIPARRSPTVCRVQFLTNGSVVRARPGTKDRSFQSSQLIFGLPYLYSAGLPHETGPP